MQCEECVYYYYDEDYEEYICKPIDIIKFDGLIKKLGLV